MAAQVKRHFRPIIWAIPPLGNLTAAKVLSPRLALDCLGEIREELVGELACSAVDQPLAELGQLAADLRLDTISEQRATILVGQCHRGAALGKPGDPALAFARYLVAVRRIEIAQRNPALESRRYRPDLHFGDGAKSIVLGSLQLLASG